MDRTSADNMLGGRIDQEVMDRTAADDALGVRIDTNWDAIAQNQEDIMTNAGHIMMNNGYIMENRGMIGTNAGNIMANAGNIAANASAIQNNTNMINNVSSSLTESIEVVRSGVAASMALAGMPAINGRGVAVGVGSFDGESAFAVGFQFQGETTSFKIGVTSSGGETGASAGVGWSF